MKKQIIILLVFFALVGIHSASAQTRFAPQIGYVAKGDGAVQLGANAEFFVNDKFSVQPAFNYYFIGNKAAGYSYSYWSLDADGHYYFTSDGSVNFYGLLGLSYLHAGIEGSGVSVSDSKFGVNLGIGANFNTSSSILPFLEVKYSSPWEGLVLTGGIRFGGKK